LSFDNDVCINLRSKEIELPFYCRAAPASCAKFC
jgi:hypothetical protein